MKAERPPEPKSPRAYFLRREAIRLKRYRWPLKDELFLIDIVGSMERGIRLSDKQLWKLKYLIASKQTSTQKRIQATIDALSHRPTADTV